MKPKILIYGMGVWSHARVYWDLINNLSNEFNFNFINWTFDGNFYDFEKFSQSFDAILIDMNSAQELIDSSLKNPKTVQKVLPICHGPQQVADYTFRAKKTRLKNYTDRNILFSDMDIFKYILCVSPNTIHAIKKEVPEISDKLILTTLGVDENNFPQSVFNRQSLNTLGYFSHFDSTEFHGINTKRGHLAATVSQRTKTPIIIKGDLPFQIMDQMYKNIDVYLMTSIYEGASTSLLEAGICGIPIIAAPAGLAPQLLQNGGGVMTETFSEEEYIYMASNVIDFWKKNPSTFCKESKIIRENTLKLYSWDNVKSMWIEGIKKFINNK